MSDKSSLHDFQSQLADRLSAAEAGLHAPSWLGIEAGGEHWLLDLSDGGEIVPAPQLNPVPLTQAWFAGIANIRGKLYAVSDLAAFCGQPPTPRNANLLLIGNRHGSNAALLVMRLLGLRNPETFVAEAADPGAPAWRAQVYRDAQGTCWYKLGVRELLADPLFMNIGR